MYDYSSDPDLPEKWKNIFAIYDRYGINGIKDSIGYREHLRTLTFLQKGGLVFSILGFLFGPIYFLFKGMVRIAFTLILILIGLVILGMIVDYLLGANIFTNLAVYAGAPLCAVTANYAYYNHKVRGYRGWNPFFAMSRKSSVSV